MSGGVRDVWVYLAATPLLWLTGLNGVLTAILLPLLWRLLM
jgi:hypothetical protein